MIAIVGASGSGKTAAVEAFLKKHDDYKKLIHYTTRPPREGEEQGRDYHFISMDEFSKLADSLFFVEISNYREWWYGLSKDDCMAADGKTIVITTPAGVRQMRYRGVNVKSIYIYVDRKSRLVKMLQRGDNVDEAYRRNLSDVGQFDGFGEETNYLIENTGYDWSADEIAGIIEEIIGRIGKESEEYEED